MDLSFAGTTFQFRLLTVSNSYEPIHFQISQTTNGLAAHTDRLAFGEGTGVTQGSFHVSFEAQPDGGIRWKASAEHAEKIKGIRVSIESLPAGTVLVPFEEINLEENSPGRSFIYPGGYYPVRHISSTETIPTAGPVHDWAAPLAFFQDGAGWKMLSAPEYPPRVKKLWLYRTGDRQVVHLYTEANASQRGTTYSAPEWRIEPTQDWQNSLTKHAEWMREAYGIPHFEERPSTQPWLKEISLVCILHGISHDGKVCHTFAEMIGVLQELAQRFPPSKTLIKLVGFEGNIDRRWPDAFPAPELGGWEGFSPLIEQAHQLGYRLIPHLNVWGSSFENLRTQPLLKHQIIDPEGRPSTWSYDYDQDEIAEEIMAYISPAAAEWRAVQVENIRHLVNAGIDAIYLDQTGTFINDLHHDHFLGLQALYADLYAAFPTTQFSGEAPNHELTTSLVSLVCGISTVPTDRLAEMYRILFGHCIRQYGYNLPPQPFRGVWGAPLHVKEGWSQEKFLQYEERSERVHGIPSLNLTDHRIDLGCDLVEVVLARARQYKIV